MVRDKAHPITPETSVEVIASDLDQVLAHYAGMQDSLDRAKEMVDALQEALNFWLPCVPANDTPFAQRAAHDASLLCGFSGCHADTAENRGWIVPDYEASDLSAMIAKLKGVKP